MRQQQVMNLNGGTMISRILAISAIAIGMFSATTALADYSYTIYPGLLGSNFQPYRTANTYDGASQINLALSNGALLGSGAVFWAITYYESGGSISDPTYTTNRFGSPATSSRGVGMDTIMSHPLSKLGSINIRCTTPAYQYNGGYYVQNFYEIGAQPGMRNCYIANVQINN